MNIIADIEKALRQKELVDAVYEQIGKVNLFNERSVIIEKYKAPICSFASIYENEEREQERERVRNEFGILFNNILLTRYVTFSPSIMSWQTTHGLLHSYNDMPSRITWDSTFIEIEWHYNGEPFRKNYKYNKIVINLNEKNSSELNRSIKLKSTIEFYMLNKKGEFHSFNDMPAIINKDSISWYWNGKKCRISRSIHSDLPCEIDVLGGITFKRRHDDVPESVRYPMSNKYHGQSIALDLKRYKKYVQWPLENLFTL